MGVVYAGFSDLKLCLPSLFPDFFFPPKKCSGHSGRRKSRFKELQALCIKIGAQNGQSAGPSGANGSSKGSGCYFPPSIDSC